jgi:endonuclease YncB( thermonuclease family)
MGGRSAAGLASAGAAALGVIGAWIVAVPAGAASPRGTPPPVTGTVQRVVAGNVVTVRVAGHRESVRLAGVRAPGCFAQPAAATLTGVLPRGTRVRLVAAGPRRRDEKGRLVAWVYRAGRAGAGTVNLALVRTGQARSGGLGGDRYAAQLNQAAGVARAKGRGQWPRCAEDPTSPLSTPREVQRRLQALGYLPTGPVSGVWDDRTQQALMAFQGWEGLERTGSLNPDTDKHLAFPSHPAPTAPGGRHVEILVGRQVLLLVDGRKVVRTIHVSTGAGGRTPLGSFAVYSKQRLSWSRPFQTWMPWAAYFDGGFALHGYGYVPGYAASHGCVRMPESEAPAVYDWVGTGTPVLVKYG